MRVFISHSSHEDERARGILEAVHRRLAERGYTVLVDAKNLRLGERWRSVLYHWLAECDSAVVLLNQAALSSHWVRREVNILLWRQLLGSPVFVVPVLIDVDMPAVTASGFEERALGVGEDELGRLAAEVGSRFLAQQLLGREGRVRHAVAGLAPWLAVEPLERLILAGSPQGPRRAHRGGTARAPVARQPAPAGAGHLGGAARRPPRPAGSRGGRLEGGHRLGMVVPFG